MKILGSLDRLSPLVAAVVGLVLVAAIGALDALTASEIGCSLLYLFPILLVSWTAGRRAGLLISVAATGVWLRTDLATAERFAHPFLPYCNGLMHFGIFVLTVLLLALFKSERAHARTDPLTGLPNRQAFFERATLESDRIRRYGIPLTLVYLDCDDFKRTNDRLGHRAGDSLLRDLARALASNIRSTDFAARLGGDEFALLLVGTGEDEARGVIEKIRAWVLESMRSRGWGLTFSIGAATYRVAPASVDDMVETADRLMYEVKRAGKGAIRLRATPSLRRPRSLATHGSELGR